MGAKGDQAALGQRSALRTVIGRGAVGVAGKARARVTGKWNLAIRRIDDDG